MSTERMLSLYGFCAVFFRCINILGHIWHMGLVDRTERSPPLLHGFCSNFERLGQIWPNLTKSDQIRHSGPLDF